MYRTSKNWSIQVFAKQTTNKIQLHFDHGFILRSLQLILDRYIFYLDKHSSTYATLVWGYC